MTCFSYTNGKFIPSYKAKISINDRSVHFSDAVILCTGGHTRIWKKSSSRKLENNGDGFH